MAIAEGRLLRLVAVAALDRLQELDPADHFRYPVPENVVGCAEAIKQPIDFSTIRRRLQWGQYRSIADVEREVKLLCTNALEFNPPDSIFHDAATYVMR